MDAKFSCYPATTTLLTNHAIMKKKLSEKFKKEINYSYSIINKYTAYRDLDFFLNRFSQSILTTITINTIYKILALICPFSVLMK